MFKHTITKNKKLFILFFVFSSYLNAYTIQNNFILSEKIVPNNIIIDYKINIESKNLYLLLRNIKKSIKSNFCKDLIESNYKIRYDRETKKYISDIYYKCKYNIKNLKNTNIKLLNNNFKLNILKIKQIPEETLVNQKLQQLKRRAILKINEEIKELNKIFGFCYISRLDFNKPVFPVLYNSATTINRTGRFSYSKTFNIPLITNKKEIFLNVNYIIKCDNN